MLVSIMIALAGEPSPAETPGRLFDGLTGVCWRTVMKGSMTDIHCFSASDGGRLVMDVHKVRSPNDVVVYSGVTLYRVEGSHVGYSYFNSIGDLMTGTATRDGSVLSFTFPGQPGLTWKLGKDSYDTVSVKETKHFERAAEAPNGL